MELPHAVGRLGSSVEEDDPPSCCDDDALGHVPRATSDASTAAASAAERRSSSAVCAIAFGRSLLSSVEVAAVLFTASAERTGHAGCSAGGALQAFSLFFR